MSKVYLVSSGSYSDYHIDAAFSTEALAQAYIDKYKDSDRWWDEPRIETWELDPHAEQERSGLVYFNVAMQKNGTTLRMEAERPRDLIADGIYGVEHEEWTLTCYVWATDAQHAVKIVNERRAMLIANNLWLRGPLA